MLCSALSETSPAKPEFLLLLSMDHFKCFPYLLSENIICFGMKLLMPFRISLCCSISKHFLALFEI